MREFLPCAIALGLVAIFLLGAAAGYSAADQSAWKLFSDSPFRLQWEILLTSVAGFAIAFRMYLIECNKAHSAFAAVVIAGGGLHRKLVSKRNKTSYNQADLSELKSFCDVALDETRRAISLTNTRAEARHINNIFASFLNISVELDRLLGTVDADGVHVEELLGLWQISAEFEGYLNDLREGQFS
jgi:hypothetical protein